MGFNSGFKGLKTHVSKVQVRNVHFFCVFFLFGLKIVIRKPQ